MCSVSRDSSRAFNIASSSKYRASASRPDFTFLVQGQLLNMDVKTPMVEYQRYLASSTTQESDAAAKAFKRDVGLVAGDPSEDE